MLFRSVAPTATGAIGDAYMELGKVEDAISFYLILFFSSNKKCSSLFIIVPFSINKKV